MFKLSKELSVSIVKEIFETKFHSVIHSQESISYFGRKIWDMIPVETENFNQRL